MSFSVERRTAAILRANVSEAFIAASSSRENFVASSSIVLQRGMRMFGSFLSGTVDLLLFFSLSAYFLKSGGSELRAGSRRPMLSLSCLLVGELGKSIA